MKEPRCCSFCHMSLWGRHCDDSLHHCRSLCEQFTLSENWVLVSDLGQIPLIHATRITSATSVCREVRKCHFGFCAFSGFRKRHSRNRIDAQQAIHTLQCKRAGDERESHHLSDRCYPSFSALVSFKLRQKLQRDKRQRSIPPNLYLSKNGSEYSCGSSDSPSLEPLTPGRYHLLVAGGASSPRGAFGLGLYSFFPRPSGSEILIWDPAVGAKMRRRPLSG